MRRGPRGGPGDLTARLARAEELLTGDPGVARDPLALLAAVLRHQLGRFGTAPEAGRRAGAGRFPLLDVEESAPAVAAEVVRAVEAVAGSAPPPLAEAGTLLVTEGASMRDAVVETWLEDMSQVEPLLGFWVQAAAGPVLEAGARALTVPADWNGAACPCCGGPPQASVIAEESGEFMAGSPRSLVCARCATWWPFARVTCPSCGEQDPQPMESFVVEDRRWARVDTCATCRSYIKTFDLREPGGVRVVPLVDDVATLTLDVWAREREWARPALSLAGV